MFLIRDHYEILADTGVAVPYVGRLLYETVHARDAHTGLIGRVTTQAALMTLVPVALIESVARAPFALIASVFSEKRSEWLHGLNFCILTALYSFYATLFNLFVTQVAPHLIEWDMNIRSFQKDQFLFNACEAGRADLAKRLLDKDADPHAIIQANTPSSLVPRMLGQLNCETLFIPNEYEREFSRLRILSQWLGLSGTVELNGESIRLDSAPSPWMFDELAEAFQRFRTDDDFSSLMLTDGNAQKIQTALFDAYREKSLSVMAHSIREGELTFVASGWEGHAICLVFFGDYMAISNRGEGSDDEGTLSVYKIDRKKVTEKTLEQIYMHHRLSKKAGMKYFYKTLPASLSASGKITQDGICEAFQSIAPSLSKAGVCALDSKTGALRFAWAMLLSDPATPDVFERAKLETKLFTSWAAAKCLDGERFSDLLPNVKPQELLFAQARQRWETKCTSHRRARRALGIGFLWGYV